MTRSEIIEYCLKQIQDIQVDLSTLNQDRAKALKYYHGEKLGNEIEGRSQVVSTDIHDTVEWIMPQMLKIFAAADEVCSLQGRTEDDVEPAEYMENLINYQLRVRNKWFMVLHDFIKDALLMKTGIIKYYWTREEQEFRKEFEGLTTQELYAVLARYPNYDLVDYKRIEQDGIVRYDATLEYVFEDEYPEIEAVPPEDVGFPRDIRDVRSVPFLYHRVTYAPWEFVERYGREKYNEVKDMIDRYKTNYSGDDEIKNQRLIDLGGIDFFWNSSRNEFYVYECYLRDPETGEALIVDLCGDVVVDYRENTYEEPPFIITPAIKLSHRLVGRSIYDILKELQELRSVLIRQILDNIYFSNLGRYIVDPLRVNLDDFINNNVPGGYIRGHPDGVKELFPPALQPWTFKLLEYLQTEKENRTGITRYNQGLDANSLNKTYRGIATIVSLSMQRMELMARVFAELGIAPLVEKIIGLNIKFLSKPTAIRITNKYIEINPDNIIGKYDVIVNVGLGTGNKDQIVAQMQQLLALFVQVVQAGVPIVTPKNVYHVFKEMIKAMGYRDIHNFLTDPDHMQPELLSAALAAGTNPGTLPGQNTPEVPTQPEQPINPRLAIDGGEFFA